MPTLTGNTPRGVPGAFVASFDCVSDSKSLGDMPAACPFIQAFSKHVSKGVAPADQNPCNVALLKIIPEVHGASYSDLRAS
eukprot:15076522-Alexandrium_andersonii.AAC.1